MILTLFNENWRAKIISKLRKIVHAELIKFPENAGSEINKLIFNDCGLERYSQLSGFAFLNLNESSNSLFKVSENYKDGSIIFVLEKLTIYLQRK